MVTVYELRKDEEGRVFAIGNSIEVPAAEAVELIQKDEAIAFGYSRGVVPQEFLDEVD